MAERIPDLAEIRCLPNIEDYGIDAPNGRWTGQLQWRAWGRSTNLFLYFEDLETGKKHRLSVFHRHQYRPYVAGPNFKFAKQGGFYLLRTEPSRNGLPKLMTAVAISCPSRFPSLFIDFLHSASP
ncbi:hypothetical protein [Crateriforma conspicua]|uniref:hypothetical protein n=1 Tax=Crateriforma conspicua TaxID=2527996 RepID=UPI00118AF5BA|nr:hypothetical protein [Crateriforma conspicua]QDV61981.1 hypothetical protein Mal65_11090 [Crateriforma conspicua]